MDEKLIIRNLEEAVIQIGKDLVKTIDKLSNIEKRMKATEETLLMYQKEEFKPEEQHEKID
jgi:hypothetical protein